MTSDRCLNCGMSLESDAAYCSSCGASVIRSDISLAYLIRDSFSTLIDWEQGTLRTFRDLVRDPGMVVRFYWDGGRKRYVEPLRFFFIAYILYQFYILLTDDRLFFIAFVEGFHAGGDGPLSEEAQGRVQLLVDVSTVLFSCILPIMAVASNAAFSRLKRSYTEHIVLNSYLIGQLLLFSILFDLLSDIPMMETAGVAAGFGIMAVFVVYALVRSLDIPLVFAIRGMLMTSFLGFILNAILFGAISAIVL